MQRRLAEHGVSFSQLLDEVRMRVADEYFRTAPRPNLAVLAHRLGYSEASAASRFLRERMGAGTPDRCADAGSCRPRVASSRPGEADHLGRQVDEPARAGRPRYLGLRLIVTVLELVNSAAPPTRFRGPDRIACVRRTR